MLALRSHNKIRSTTPETNIAFVSHGGPGYVVCACPVLALWISSQPYWHLWPLNHGRSRHRCGCALCEEALAQESSLSHNWARLSSWGILNKILNNYVLLYIFIWSRFIWNTKAAILLFQNTLHDVQLCHPLKLNMQLNIFSFTSLKDGHIIQSHYLLSNSSLLCPKVE